MEFVLCEWCVRGLAVSGFRNMMVEGFRVLVLCGGCFCDPRSRGSWRGSCKV